MRTDRQPAPPGADAAHGRRPGGTFHVCFHGIGTPHHEREPGEAGYWVTDERFLTLLDWLAEVPGVVLSFDDGNRSDLIRALPAVTERGLTATFFPVVGRLGDPWSLSGPGVAELADAGMQIGSHGQWHLPWRGLRGEAATEEIVRPHHTLEDLLGRPVDRAAVPLGRYDRRSLALLRSTGCAEVHTSDQRPARHGAWVRPRFSVRAGDTTATLRARMLASLAPVRRSRNAVFSTAKRWT